MKTSLLLLCMLLVQSLQAQNLEKLLWDNLKECNESIKNSLDEEDMPENKMEIYDKLDFQLANGYLSIAGTWPTCGCGCAATVAGFKDEKGSFTMLKYENWTCDDKFGVYSSRKIEDVFPTDFGLSSFAEDGKKMELNGSSYFYLKAEIPSKGTDTKVSIHLYPLGMVGKSSNGLSYNTDKAKIENHSMSDFLGIIKKLENAKQLQSILDDKIHELPETITHLIDDNISEQGAYKSREDFRENLLLLNEYYKAYSQISFTEMVLAWDKKMAKFTIKSKGGTPKKMELLDFLKTMEYYSVKC